MDHTGQGTANEVIMGKITFYEDRNFGGRWFECSSDCVNLLHHLSCCYSIKVQSGSFMIYEEPSFRGTQQYLKTGEYPDTQQCMGDDLSIRSCRHIPVEPVSFNMRMFERLEFGGRVMDLTEDCPDVMERFYTKDIFSCKVRDGHWLFYEQPNYCGKMYLIRPGEYIRFSEWGARSARVGSIKRIMDSD